MDGGVKLVTAFFPDKISAEKAYLSLPDFDIPVEDVSLIGRHGELHVEPVDDEGPVGTYRGDHLVVHNHKLVVKDSKVFDGALAGAGVGTVLGALAGIVLGSGFVVIPAVGLVLAGPLVGALIGGSMAVGESVPHALQGLGMPEGEAKRMAAQIHDRLRKGGVVMVVTTEASRMLAVQEALQKLGGQPLGVPSGAAREGELTHV